MREDESTSGKPSLASRSVCVLCQLLSALPLGLPPTASMEPQADRMGECCGTQPLGGARQCGDRSQPVQGL